MTDGDTLRLDCGSPVLPIRLDGPDAPELGQDPWGVDSRALLAELWFCFP